MEANTVYAGLLKEDGSEISGTGYSRIQVKSDKIEPPFIPSITWPKTATDWDIPKKFAIYSDATSDDIISNVINLPLPDSCTLEDGDSFTLTFGNGETKIEYKYSPKVN